MATKISSDVKGNGGACLGIEARRHPKPCATPRRSVFKRPAPLGASPSKRHFSHSPEAVQVIFFPFFFFFGQ